MAPSDPSTPTPAPGMVVDGKYRVEAVLGRGGMGVVVEARHLQLGTLVALKLLRRTDASATSRFLLEARATAALRSEHICRIFDVGAFDGVPYLVMERLDGLDLAKLLRARTRLPVHEACEYVWQACAGLAEAHAADIVHRDLKPSNLFVTARGDGTPLIKLLDFGIAKVRQDDDAELTGTGVVLGSPPYMSLEQLRASKLVDKRTDIWSLGVILFELLSGQRPFVGDGIADLALKIAAEPTPRLPFGPAALDPIVACCLARAPEYRYQDVGELAAVLAPLRDPRVDVERVSVSASNLAVEAPPLPDSTMALSAGPVDVRPARRRSSRAAAALALLAIAAVTAFVVARGRGDVRPDAPPPPVAPAPVEAAAHADESPHPSDAATQRDEAPAHADEPAPAERPVGAPARKHPPAKPKPATPRQTAPAEPGVVELSKTRI